MWQWLCANACATSDFIVFVLGFLQWLESQTEKMRTQYLSTLHQHFNNIVGLLSVGQQRWTIFEVKQTKPKTSTHLHLVDQWLTRFTRQFISKQQRFRLFFALFFMKIISSMHWNTFLYSENYYAVTFLSSSNISIMENHRSQTQRSTCFCH